MGDDEESVRSAPALDRMIVHWYGTVEKIGRQLSSHTRVVFVTDGAVFVCLPTGGVTRTIGLEKIHLAFRAPGSVCQLFESGGPSLVTRHPTDDDRDELIAHLRLARGAATGAPDDLEGQDVSTLNFDSAPRETRLRERSSPAPALAPPDLPPGFRRVDAGTPSRRDADRATGPSPGGDPSRPEDAELRNPFEAQRLAMEDLRNNDIRAASEQAPSLVLQETRSAGPMAPAPAGQASPKEKAPVTAVGMRPSRSGRASAPRDADVPNNTSLSSRGPTPTPAAPAAKPTPNSSTAQLADLRHALDTGVDVVDAPSLHALRQQVNQQQQVINEMRQAADTTRVTELKRELDHAQSLIADLQTALRSQETTFAEMLRAQESARASQAIQSSLEAQVAALTQERDSLRAEAQSARSEADHFKAAKDSQSRQHDRELARVREAFVQYDANVAEYLEEVRIEHAAEVDRARRAGREQGSVAAARGATSPPPAPSHRAAEIAPPGAGVAPDALRSALMRHLNSYANARLNLPVGDPLPGSPAPEPAATPRRAAARDRSLL